MKKLITLFALIVFSITIQAQAYSETSNDSIVVVTEWHAVKGTINVSSNAISIKAKKIVKTLENGALVSKDASRISYLFRESDTLFKLRWTTDTTYIVKDTFLVENVYNKLSPVTLNRLLKKAIKFELKP